LINIKLEYADENVNILDKRGDIIKYAYGRNETFFQVSTPFLQK